MPANQTEWIVKQKISSEISQNLRKYPNLIQQILYNRGLTTEDEADEYLRANSPEYSPFLLKDLERAVEIIHQAVMEKKKVIVFGDYDVDGVTSSVLLVQLLQAYGASVDVFIPNRFDEGYGLSFDAVHAVMEMEPNPDLIVTVDCGVRSVKEVDHLNELGVQVVITDHHQPHDRIPAADAVVCPKQPGDSYPYKELAGVGLAYKLAQGLLEKHPIKGITANDWIELVAVGTIADLAALDGENRTLVRQGLRRMRFGQHKGLLALANVSGTNIEQCCSEDIGFRIGPRLNAAGRLDSARLAFDLLMAKTTEVAGSLALRLDAENRKRQLITQEMVKKAEEKYDPQLHQNILFIWDENFHEGVVGLAASKLVEKFYRPAIVGVLKDGMIHASCRSIEEVNITQALDQCAQYLEKHGGHAMAAGLTISTEQTVPFMKAMDTACREMVDGKTLAKKYHAESEVTFKELLPENLKYYELLEPLGNGNPAPLFVTRNVKVKHVKKIGQEQGHLKLSLSDDSMNFSAIAWRFADSFDALKEANTIDILYAFEKNTYNGDTTLQLRIVDFLTYRN